MNSKNFEIVDGLYLDDYRVEFDGRTEIVRCIAQNLVDGEKSVDMHFMEKGINNIDNVEWVR